MKRARSRASCHLREESFVHDQNELARPQLHRTIISFIFPQNFISSLIPCIHSNLQQISLHPIFAARLKTAVLRVVHLYEVLKRPGLMVKLGGRIEGIVGMENTDAGAKAGLSNSDLPGSAFIIGPRS